VGERLGAPQVLEEQGGAVEAGRLPRPLVAEQGGGELDVESNDSPNAWSLPTATLSRAVQGRTEVRLRAPYSGGSGWWATQALTPSA
jgi:hypothetical protein